MLLATLRCGLPAWQLQLPLQESVAGWVSGPCLPIAVIVDASGAGGGCLHAATAAHADHSHAAGSAGSAAHNQPSACVQPTLAHWGGFGRGEESRRGAGR